jgi:hypothetical protein
MEGANDFAINYFKFLTGDSFNFLFLSSSSQKEVAFILFLIKKG